MGCYFLRVGDLEDILAAHGTTPRDFVRAARKKGAPFWDKYTAAWIRAAFTCTRMMERWDRQDEARAKHRPHTTRKGERALCGATTRAGHPCEARAVWDKENDRPRNGRCRLHGGLSTGARTLEGRERARQAVIRRWERWREERL